MITETYITKYRPISLDEVIGHKNVIISLQELFKNKATLPHGFIFVSDPGCGKTSFSRIIGNKLDCIDTNIIEVDAGIVTGVDAMRELISNLRYGGLGLNSNKLVILDEVHKLSSSAWDALLKTLEEPPPHVYFCLCTTDGKKVPETIKTRCHVYNLKPVDSNEIYNLLKLVKENENLEIPNDCLELISNECNGSPRQALSYLSQCRACKTKKEVADLIESAVENNEVIELCKALTKKTEWHIISNILKNLKKQQLQPESIRINIANWFNACTLNSSTATDAAKFLTILNNFSKPIYENTGWATLTLSCGGSVFNE